MTGTPVFAERPEDLFTLEQLRGMTGLEAMQGMLDGRFPSPPIARTLGYALHAVAEGRAVFRGAPSFAVLNPMGTAHGGWYGTLLDSCMACAVMTRLARGQVYTTLEYKLNIIRPVPVGMMVDAVGEASHVGRSTGVAEGRMVGVEDGRLYATASTTCLVMTAG